MKRFIYPVLVVFLIAASCSVLTKQDIAVVNGEKISTEELYKYIPPANFAALASEEKENMISGICDDYLAMYYLRDNGDLDSGEVKWEIKTWEIRELANGAYQTLVIDKLLTESALRSLYEKMKFELNISHILIAYDNAHKLNERTREEALALAEELVQQANSDNFEELAMEYSDDRSKEKNSGNLGWAGTGYFVENFEDAAFKLEPGEIVGPVETAFGFHIIRLNERRNIPLEPFESMMPELRETIMNRWSLRFAERESFVFDSLKTASPLDLNDSLLQDFVERFHRLSTNVFYAEQFTAYDIMDIFDDTLTIGTLGKQVINKEWIVQYLKMISLYMPPRFTDVSSFMSFVDRSLMGSLLYTAAHDLGLDKSPSYLRTKKVYLAKKSASLFDKLYVFDRINPDSRELNAFYEKKRDELYTYEPRVQVCEILVKDSTEAKKLLRRARDGEDMGDLAAQYSIRNIGKTNRGIIPPIKKNQYGEMSLAAFNMVDGEIAGPFKLGEYYSIIKRVEYLPQTYRDIESVKYRLLTDYRNHHMPEKRAEQKAMLRQTYHVRINPSFTK